MKRLSFGSKLLIPEIGIIEAMVWPTKNIQLKTREIIKLILPEVQDKAFNY